MTTEPVTGRRKVAILGGGCGGLAAAWALTAPELGGRFEVSVYERGWQLGGKGASGRMPHDGGGGHRIEEHGLHIWFGFYDHAFRMLRAAYEEAGLAQGDDWWRTPFEKCNSVSLYERRADGTWVQQRVALPSADGTGPPTEPRSPSLATMLASVTRLVSNGARAELGWGATRRGVPVRVADPLLDETVQTLDEVGIELERFAGSVDGGPGTVRRGVSLWPARGRDAALAALVNRLETSLQRLREALDRTPLPDRARLWRDGFTLLLATLLGISREGLLWRGLAEIDNEDLRAWLARNGASEAVVERSPVLRGLYDLTFAYLGGDKRQPSLAAGKGLQALLLMLTYRGAFMWRMRAGMGDVVFSPLYIALKRRGVDFHFFSRVTALRLAPGRPVVDRIEIVREATVAAGPDAYDPIERIGDWWCWPGEPLADQLSDRSRRDETLVRGIHFDDVVLAIPVGAQGEICAELADANPRYKRMLEGSHTVRTKALQLWTTEPIRALCSVSTSGASGPPLDPPATAYAEPFDTYCDMSQLLSVEGYDGDGPRGVAYFCAVLPDEVAEHDAVEEVRSGAAAYLQTSGSQLWPNAFRDERIDWEVLYDPQGRRGPDRLEAQYFRANTDRSDRYVTTPAGSVDARLDPEASGFENLVLAGDWTHNVIDGGCVEAAVISGRRAGDALVQRAGLGRADGRVPGARPVRRGAGPVADEAPAPVAWTLPPYVEFGALSTVPGPLEGERARLYCFFLSNDRERVQRLCDRVLKQPTGGALRYRVPRVHPVVLTFGTISGLRSLHGQHAEWGSASEPEAAIWIPVVAQRWDDGRYVDDHMAVFMPYIWVDDPVAFASGREVYGFPKTQGWMTRVGDPYDSGEVLPDPPPEMHLDVYGTDRYSPSAELGRRRLITVRRRDEGPARRGHPPAAGFGAGADERELADLMQLIVAELDGDSSTPRPAQTRRGGGGVAARLSGVLTSATGLKELLVERVVRHVFLKQIRDAESGSRAVLQQIVEARSNVTDRSLSCRYLLGAFDVNVASLESHPLQEELGLKLEETTRLAFAAEFGFRMEAGRVLWPPSATAGSNNT